MYSWIVCVSVMEPEKEVLVGYGERKRPVRFQASDDPDKERCSLLAAVRDTFKDVLEQDDDGTSPGPSGTSMILQIKSEKWSGEFVEVHGPAVVPDSSVLRLSLGNGENKEEMKSTTAKAVDYCRKVGKASEQSAKTLKKLFPACSSSSLKEKRRFDPGAECVAAAQKRRKKATNTRVKPRTIAVVLLQKRRMFVPKGYARAQLNKAGRVVKLEFRRNLSSQEVKNIILRGFSGFDDVERAQYLNCGRDNMLYLNKEQELDGDGIFELAGQGSLYLVQEPVEGGHKHVIHVSSSESDDDRDPVVLVNSEPAKDVDTPKENEPVQNQESLEQWRAIRNEQDRAYEESLQADREKARRIAEEQARKQRVDAMKGEFAQLFREKCGDDDGVKVAFKLPDGRKVEHRFPRCTHVQELYQFILSQGVVPPFSVSTSLPRMALAVSVVGEDGLHCHGIEDSLLMVEQSDDELDGFLDLLQPKSAASSGAVAPTSTVDSSGDVGPTDDEIVEVSVSGEEMDDLRPQTDLEKERLDFMRSLNSVGGLEHSICRSDVYEHVLQLYRGEKILRECPIRIEFEDEMAVDQGGVTRDMFSAFWEKCYSTLFEGSNLLVPLLHPQTDASVFPIIGRIISHGYLVSGFMPVRIALPSLMCILCGPGTIVPQPVLQGAFLDYISSTERLFFKEALKCAVFTPDMQDNLLNTLTRFGCRQLPAPSNLVKCLQQIAHYEFCCKPAAAIALMHSGVPSNHSKFWSADGVCSMYRSLTVSGSKILGILEFPGFQNPAEERVAGYLLEMVGNMMETDLQRFLRFTTGSSVLIASRLSIEFNGLSGLARRPIAHTCDDMLELPVAYNNYHDFHSEWMAILGDSDLFWRMDCC